MEYRVCGTEEIDIQRLKSKTVYKGAASNAENETIKLFWKIMDSLNNKERALYLKFVWGRTRLPLKEEDVPDHTIYVDADANV